MLWQKYEVHNLKLFLKIDAGINLNADTDRLDKRAAKQRGFSVLPMAVTRHYNRLCRISNRSVITFRRSEFLAYIWHAF